MRFWPGVPQERLLVGLVKVSENCNLRKLPGGNEIGPRKESSKVSEDSSPEVSTEKSDRKNTGKSETGPETEETLTFDKFDVSGFEEDV